MTFNANVFGIVTGTLGLVGILQLIVFIILYYLPSRRLACLDAIMNDLEPLLLHAAESGILRGSDHSLECDVVITTYVRLDGHPRVFFELTSQS